MLLGLIMSQRESGIGSGIAAIALFLPEAQIPHCAHESLISLLIRVYTHLILNLLQQVGDVTVGFMCLALGTWVGTQYLCADLSGSHIHYRKR